MAEYSSQVQQWAARVQQLEAAAAAGPASSSADAVARLIELVQSVAHTPKARRATKPTYGSKMRRLEGKAQRSSIKAGRGKVGSDH